MIELQNIKSPIIRVLLFSLLAFVVVLMGSVGTASANTDVRLEVEGRPLTPAVPPQIVEDRTVVPVRVIGEALGAQVDWDGETRQVTITRRGEVVVLTIDSTEALVNGRPVTLSVAAQIIDDRTMVPLRFVGEAFGDTVDWDGETRTVRIYRRPSRVVAANLVKEVGQAYIDLELSEPLLEWKPSLVGNAVVLDLYPAVVDMPEPERLLGDPLIKSLGVQATSDRTSRFTVEFWDQPLYKVAASSDGMRLRITVEYQVTDIKYRLDGLTPTVYITANGPLNYATHALSQPNRIVVDIAGAAPSDQVPETLPVDNTLLQRVRSSHFAQAPNTTRVVLDLNREHPYEVLRSDTGLVIRLTPHLSNILVENHQGLTRLTFKGSVPLQGTLRHDPDGKRLLIELPQAKSVVPNPNLQVGDGTINSVTVTSGPAPGSLIVTVQLPYYVGHQLVSKPGDVDMVIDVVTSPLYGKRIWIDPGHGGSDGGAAGTTYGPGLEKVVNLQLGLELQRQLTEAGATVLMTRTTDTFVSLQEITRRANEAHPDVFVSLHHNSTAAQDGRARGAETYYYTSQSRRLADAVHAAFIQGTGQPDRKVKHESFHVVRETIVPSILIEVGFLDNETDEALARDPEFQQRAAAAIKQGLMHYFTQ